MISALTMGVIAGGRGASATDPYWSSVTQLCHFDGSDGGTTYTNEKSGGSMFANIDLPASLSTGAAKFGPTSLRCASRFVFDSVSDNYAFGVGDFTIEFWVYFVEVATVNVAGGLGNTTSPLLYILSNGSLIWYNGSDRISSATGVITTDTWKHIAVCRISDNTRMFVDGTQVGSIYVDSADMNGTYGWYLGTYAGQTAPMNGYIDEFRVTKGVGRYASNFTPETTQFPNR
jgi:hypothetical protein